MWGNEEVEVSLNSGEGYVEDQIQILIIFYREIGGTPKKMLILAAH